MEGRAAATAILDEGGMEAVGLCEAARRIGVSAAAAAYRHFASKEHLLASVAAEGFRELSAAMDAAANEPSATLGRATAYVEFALQKRGLFRRMYGPVLTQRRRFPKLKEAAKDAFSFLQVARAADGRSWKDKREAVAAWGLAHGLSSLLIGGLVPEKRMQPLAEKIIMTAVTP